MKINAKPSSLLFGLITLLISTTLSSQNFTLDQTTRFVHYSVNDGLPSNKINDIKQDHRGLIWIATSEGLCSFDGYRFNIYQHTDSSSISNNYITSIDTDIHGNIWVGTKFGLNCIKNNDGEIQHIFDKGETDFGLFNNYVRAILCKNDTVFVETADGTLNILDQKNQRFSYHFHDNVKQLYYDYHAIYADKESQLWIAGRNIGPLKFDQKHETFIDLNDDPKFSSLKVYRDCACFLEDIQNNFWFGAYNGLYEYNRKSGELCKVLSLSIRHLAEDQAGSLWIGTRDGLIKKEKEENSFTIFSHDDKLPTTLISNNINKLFADKEGNIWIGTDNGISVYSAPKNRFKHYAHQTGLKDELSSNHVSCFLEDTDGDIWIGTMGGGLNLFHPETGKFEQFKSNDANNPIPSNDISKLYQDKKGTIWIGFWSGTGFCSFNKKNKTYRLFALDPNSSQKDWYNDIVELSDGSFWLGVWGARGMMQFDRQKWDITGKHFIYSSLPYFSSIEKLVFASNKLWMKDNAGTFKEYDPVSKEYFTLIPSIINSKKDALYYNCSGMIATKLDYSLIQSLADFENRTVVATKNKLYFASRGFQLEEINLHLKPAETISNIAIASNLIIQTTQQLITFNGKQFSSEEVKESSTLIDVLKVNNQSYQIFSRAIYAENGKQIPLPANCSINDAIVFNHDIWLATNKGILVLGNGNKIENKLFDNGNKNLWSEEVLTFYKPANDQEIWIGTSRGLNTYSNSKNQLSKIEIPRFENNENPTKRIQSIAGNDSLIWLATNSGIIEFNRITSRFNTHNVLRSFQLSSHLISKIMEDSRGNIWVGTTNMGLNKMSPDRKTIQHYLYSESDSSSFWKENVNAIFEDSKHNIWIGGYGLSLYQPETNNFKHITKADGLPDQNVLGILEDDQQNLWITTENGLCKFHPEQNTFKTYTIADGLQDNIFTGAHLKLSNGQFLVGGNNGFNIFDPKNIESNNSKPQAWVTDFYIFDKKFKSLFNNGDTIKLSFTQNFFKFHFSSMNYSSLLNNTYAYLLEGIDHQWRTTKTPEANYTNLNPGEYQFKLKATNSDNIWSDNLFLLTIIITPPFYQTGWFYLLVSIAIISILGVIFASIVHRINNKNRILKLERKLLLSQLNPHFIFNTLNAIQGFFYNNDLLNASRFLARFSKLMRQILEFSREDYISLEEELALINNYLSIQQLRFENQFKFTVAVDPEIDPRTIAIPPMLAQPFLENSIEHGVKNMKETGEINITYTKKDKLLSVVITDNGPGYFSKNTMDQQRSKHKSLGNKITKERLSRYSKKTEINIEDLTQSGSGKGTRISFLIPCQFFNPKNIDDDV